MSFFRPYYTHKLHDLFSAPHRASFTISEKYLSYSFILYAPNYKVEPTKMSFSSDVLKSCTLLQCDRKIQTFPPDSKKFTNFLTFHDCPKNKLCGTKTQSDNALIIFFLFSAVL